MKSEPAKLSYDNSSIGLNETKRIAILTSCTSCSNSYNADLKQVTGGKCPECYEELTSGKIPDLTTGRSFNFGIGLRSNVKDSEPSFENVVRCLEDRSS